MEDIKNLKETFLKLDGFVKFVEVRDVKGVIIQEKYMLQVLKN